MTNDWKTFTVAYYRDIVLILMHKCHCRRDADIFQQDSAPAYHERQTTELLLCETPKFIGWDLWAPNSLDLDPAN